jgi:hypothetical protein
MTWARKHYWANRARPEGGIRDCRSGPVTAFWALRESIRYINISISIFINIFIINHFGFQIYFKYIFDQFNL